jgi:predicted ATPase
VATVRRNNPTDERQGGARIAFGNILMDLRAGRLTRALEVASEYEAPSLELRAATSLARAWHQRGRDADARAVLAGAYGRFDPGDDSPDLAEARTLLRSLSTAA